MEPDNDEYIKIIEIMQRGRIKPAKYRYSLRMPKDIFAYLHKVNVIDIEYYHISDSIFFEFKEDIVILNFKELYICEDIHIRSLSALVSRSLGKDPIVRAGEFYMSKNINK